MRYFYTSLFSLISLAAFAQFDFGDAIAKYENDAQLQKLYLDLGPLLIIQNEIYVFPCECTTCTNTGGSSNDGNLGGGSNKNNMNGANAEGKLGGGSNQGKLGGASNDGKLGGGSGKGKLGGGSGKGKLGGAAADGKLGGGSNDGKLGGASKAFGCKRSGKKIKLLNYSERIDIYFYGAKGKELVNKGLIKF